MQALKKGGYHGGPGSLKFPVSLSVKSLKEEALVVGVLCLEGGCTLDGVLVIL